MHFFLKIISTLRLYYSVLQGGYTALIWAAGEGYVDIVQTLLDHGAAVDLRNKVTLYTIV